MIEPKPWDQMTDVERLAHLRQNAKPRPLDWLAFREAAKAKRQKSAQQAERDSGNAARSA